MKTQEFQSLENTITECIQVAIDKHKISPEYANDLVMGIVKSENVTNLIDNGNMKAVEHGLKKIFIDDTWDWFKTK